MTHITDEAVELACKAIADRQGFLWPEEFSATQKTTCRENMRAALEAATPKPEPLGWINEDELPSSYPYDAMFPYSKVDVVRMFPVYAAPTLPLYTAICALLAAESFIAGFEDDDTQKGVDEKLQMIRVALYGSTLKPKDVAAGLSPWTGWDDTNYPWSHVKHQDEVCRSVFRAPWSIEDAATLIGFIARTWPNE
jgi:hypothetical protein